MGVFIAWQQAAAQAAPRLHNLQRRCALSTGPAPQGVHPPPATLQGRVYVCVGRQVGGQVGGDTGGTECDGYMHHPTMFTPITTLEPTYLAGA